MRIFLSGSNISPVVLGFVPKMKPEIDSVSDHDARAGALGGRNAEERKEMVIQLVRYWASI